MSLIVLQGIPPDNANTEQLIERQTCRRGVRSGQASRLTGIEDVLAANRTLGAMAATIYAEQ